MIILKLINHQRYFIQFQTQIPHTQHIIIYCIKVYNKKKTPTLNYRNCIENVCTLNNNIVLPQQNENHPGKKTGKFEFKFKMFETNKFPSVHDFSIKYTFYNISWCSYILS